MSSVIFRLSEATLGVVLITETSLALLQLPTCVGWVGVEMTRTTFLAAAAAICSIIVVAAGATFRNALSNTPQASAENDFEERWISIKKSDRLPLAFAAGNALPELAPPVAPPPGQLPLATKDDLRQAAEEHQRRRDICRHGRTYFTIAHHQYWRCRA